VLIMTKVIAMLQSDILHAIGIWALLVMAGLFALLVFKSRFFDLEPEPAPTADPARPRRHAQHARELIRYAQEVAVAAERAQAMAQRRREEWLAAQAQLDEAWQAFEASDADAQRLARAAALPPPRAPKTPSEYAYRERYLHRAAMAACSRKQLSPLDLSDALAHRKGWDPKRHPADQEVVLRRAVRDCMWASYRAAAKRERAAWRSAGVADESKVSLREEARMAMARATQAAAGKPLALAGDTVILPNARGIRTGDTMILPNVKGKRTGDTMVLPNVRGMRTGDTMVLPVIPKMNRPNLSPG
jgi:hypothetical protein